MNLFEFKNEPTTHNSKIENKSTDQQQSEIKTYKLL